MILSEADMQLADLGLLQHVPHVMLHFEYDTDLFIPAGSGRARCLWCESCGCGVQRPGRFLSRTKEFVFESAYRWDEGPAMYQPISGASQVLGCSAMSAQLSPLNMRMALSRATIGSAMARLQRMPHARAHDR